MSDKRRALVLALFIALLAGLWMIPGSAQQQTALPQLGVPPTFPPRPAGLPPQGAAEAVTPPVLVEGPLAPVNPANREASRTFFITNYLNAPTPAIEWSGNRATCDAGTTSPGFRDAVATRVNYFRAMAGVPAQVTLLDAYNADTQRAALMMSVNNQLSHNPSTSWQCFSAQGAAAAGKSNLFLGVHGWDAITGYVRDPGANNGPAGHRRWILYPQTQNMGTGDLPQSQGQAAANALWVIDSHIWEPRPATRDAYVAWPPPGYVSYQVVFPRWSFSYPDADFSLATVQLTREGQAVPVRKETVAPGYGENTLVWAIEGMDDWDDWPHPLADTTYTVSIDLVRIAGTFRSFTYDVIVMDPAQETPSPVVSDLTGDRKSDILWHHATRGEVWLWPMDGASKTAESHVRTVADTNWEMRGLGDQDGDGHADLLWRNRTTGGVYYWPMNGSSPQAELYVGAVDPAYDIVGTGDFNADHNSDILWRHLGNGEVWVWLMNGATRLDAVYLGTVAPAYKVKGVADLNGDRRADIVWHHETAGEVWAWLMDGTTVLSRTWVGTVADTGYQVAGVADHTGDGQADILWHHATRGEVWLWTMNGATRAAQTWVGTVADPNYRIVGTGDYDGDLEADILWHHASVGEVWVWQMDGATMLSQTWVGTVADVGYRVVATK